MKGWRGYLVLVLVSVLLGAGVMFGVLHARGQRLAREAVAQAAADSVQIDSLRTEAQAHRAQAVADSLRADSAWTRAAGWQRTAARLGATTAQLRATLDMAGSALDSFPHLVLLVATQDSTIAAKDSVIQHKDDAFAAQRRAAAQLTASLAATESALTVSEAGRLKLVDDLRAASMTKRDRGSGLQIGAGAGYCTTGDPCVGVMVFKSFFRIPLT